MGYEFWGPRLPRRQASPSGAQRPKTDLNHYGPSPLIDFDGATPKPTVDPDIEPVAGRLLADWAEGQRERLECELDLDIWDSIKDRLEED